MAKNKKELLSVIVPCYNEEEALPLFYEETVKVLNTLEDVDYEIIFVDDGSKDKTIDKMMNLSREDKNVKYFSFSRNFGKESAMYAGLYNADGDYVVIMDADLQHPPVMIAEMLNAVKYGEYDVAAARRVTRDGDNKITTFFARTFYKIINSISEVEMMDGAGDFRLMRRNVVDAILSMSEYYRFSKGIFSWVGYKTYWIEYENVDRVAGTTSWSFMGLLKYAIDGIMNFSLAPLNMCTIMGVILMISSFVYLLFIVVKYAIYGDPVAGWPTLMCVILILGGIVLLNLGIIGQYVGKTYMESKGRPHYIISKTNDKDAKKVK
ncbi:MAG: glycosyltransferase family 2 protein [Erysipelotrichaceae bacterium]|nr:glycosyltransferase family 2 protein [Erysipelotrichaceae bacterium]